MEALWQLVYHLVIFFYRQCVMQEKKEEWGRMKEWGGMKEWT